MTAAPSNHPRPRGCSHSGSSFCGHRARFLHAIAAAPHDVEQKALRAWQSSNYELNQIYDQP